MKSDFHAHVRSCAVTQGQVPPTLSLSLSLPRPIRTH